MRDPNWELAIAHLNARRIPEALVHFDLAEQGGYDADQCAGGRWECHMLGGDLALAWAESEAIARRGAPDPHRYWNGEPFDGRRVIVRTLHGFGDAIQFIRYAPLIRERAKSLVVQTHPQLVSLFATMQSIDRVIQWEQDADWDQQIEVMELPRAFGTTLASIPDRVPYLSVTEELRERGRVRTSGDGRLKVGLVWAASDYNPARNVPVAYLEPLLALKQFAFYSFQRGAARVELDGVRDLCDSDPAIAACAGDLIHMDAVVTVDTMLAHLAGALALPTFTMLHDRADWRWMVQRCTSPWYPTMRLVRQRSPGDWRDVVARTVEFLVQFGNELRPRARQPGTRPVLPAHSEAT